MFEREECTWIAVLLAIILAGPHRVMAEESELDGGSGPSSERQVAGVNADPGASIARGQFVAFPHRPNYILPFTYVHRPNTTSFLATDPETDWKHQEIKFQISLKVPVANRLFGARGDRFGNNLDFWFGYTQQSYWQAYHFKRSAPFRESNYEPELGFTYRGGDNPVKTPIYRSGLFTVPSVSAGFAHQSNGQGGFLSRSWNRIWVSFVLGYGESWIVGIKPWLRVPEKTSEDDNPEILDYAGRAEFMVLYRYSSHQLSAIVRNNLRAQDNRSGYELDWTFPVPIEHGKFKLIVQLYNGFGESLIDYDVRTRRIGFGVLVNDWR